MSKIHIIANPSQRTTYLQTLLEHEGLSTITEDHDAAYCPISLTLTPEALKKPLLERQQILMDDVLRPAGITPYDPSSAPYSPDTNKTSLPDEVYRVDSGKILSARFFVGHHIIASTGFGVELEKAKVANRISVILMDASVRISRMQPNRTIYLQYTDFAQQISRFVEVFELLRQYDPGFGLEDGVPILLGFHKQTGSVENLELLIARQFPDLVYRYDGTVPILSLVPEDGD